MPPQLEPWPLQHSLLDTHAAAHSLTCLSLPPNAAQRRGGPHNVTRFQIYSAYDDRAPAQLDEAEGQRAEQWSG